MAKASSGSRRPAARVREGWKGWDEYAPFYDWENARTLGRRDVGFWTRVIAPAKGPVLELGCGTGRITLPLARSGAHVVGIDRSAPMLARAHRRRRARAGTPVELVRGDIRFLPFADEQFDMVLAPYGILQSLTRPRDLTATLQAVARVIKPNGLFGIDLVPDVPQWREYRNKVTFRGTLGRSTRLTLTESVHQDTARGLTTFEQQYQAVRNGVTATHRFDLTFRTVSVKQMAAKLARAGFFVEAVLGDYRGRPWDDRADVWILLARRAKQVG